jgi:membrane peptidoglycan carboxypeptidase
MTSIPYGYEISANPLQVLQAYAAIANGGVMVKPYLVQRLEAADGTPLKEFGPREVRRVCSARTARRMTELMKWVVEKGTATAVALPNYAIAGKTGTAYKFMKGHYSRNNYVSSFVGFVPAEDPKFVIYVSLDDPRGLYWGGYTAGPVFKEVAKRAMAYERIPTSADPVEPREAGTGRTVPSFTGLTPVQCRWLAERAQLKLKFQGKGERVVLQSEKAGFVQAVPGRGAAVFLTLGEPEAVKAQGLMPDLQGKTKRQALALLAPLGMKVNFRGEGVVRFQFPPAGRKVGESGLCELNCDTPLTRSAQGTPGGKS